MRLLAPAPNISNNQNNAQGENVLLINFRLVTVSFASCLHAWVITDKNALLSVDMFHIEQ